jgi:hypothetical protein
MSATKEETMIVTDPCGNVIKPGDPDYPGAVVESLHCHVAPEPIEAPEPRPVERQRDLVRRNAILWGWSVMTAQGSPSTVGSFAAGVEAFEQYRAAHDRRKPL